MKTSTLINKCIPWLKLWYTQTIISKLVDMHAYLFKITTSLKAQELVRSHTSPLDSLLFGPALTRYYMVGKYCFTVNLSFVRWAALFSYRYTCDVPIHVCLWLLKKRRNWCRQITLINGILIWKHQKHFIQLYLMTVTLIIVNHIRFTNFTGKTIIV